MVFSTRMNGQPVPETVEEDATYNTTDNNFGTAFAANSVVFSNLTEANQHLGTNVAASVQSI